MEFLNQLINFLKTNLNSIINEIDLINLSISISLFFIILIFKNVIKLTIHTTIFIKFLKKLYIL